MTAPPAGNKNHNGPLGTTWWGWEHDESPGEVGPGREIQKNSLASKRSAAIGPVSFIYRGANVKARILHVAFGGSAAPAGIVSNSVPAMTFRISDSLINTFDGLRLE